MLVRPRVAPAAPLARQRPAFIKGVPRMAVVTAAGKPAQQPERASPLVTAPLGWAAAALATTLLLGPASPSAWAVTASSPPDNSTVQQTNPISQAVSNLTAPALSTPDNYELPSGRQWRYSEFLDAVDKGAVDKVLFATDGTALQLLAKDGRTAVVTLPNDPSLIDLLTNKNIEMAINDNSDTSGLWSLLPLLFPILSFGALFFLFRRSQSGSGGDGDSMGPFSGGPMAFGRSKSKFQEVPETGVTFGDVAGCDGAKLELQEVVDFLKNPDKYTALGAKIPTGCLLVGPPGTGKTLLAKAVAGEAGVPFFSCAASEFVELFVGVGASRVRDLFEKAKAKAPCIVFIDEIDAVGRQRGAGMGGGNDEREQTINQLLTEMDGFEGNTGVIVLAATNRPDVLDQALLRPGRFDRQVTVDRPDVAGRIDILKVHARGKALAPDVDLEKISRRTPGFTGADLQNLLNEAAILAARRNLKEVGQDEIADALERIIAGPEKKGAVMSEAKKQLVAYHEAGHAIVGALLPEYDPVSKISIVPRGAAGGLTFFAPSEERLESGLYSRTYLENQMAVALGGRIAEELMYGEDNITTGASNDFQQVSRIARLMVTQLGLGDLQQLGQVCWSQSGGNTFLGGQMAQPADFSSATADTIDKQVKLLVERAYRRAKDLLTRNQALLHQVAERLIDKENLDGEELQALIRDAQAELYQEHDPQHVKLPFQQPVPIPSSRAEVRELVSSLDGTGAH